MAKKAWALDDRKQLHKEANKALDENLLPGEAVRVIVGGDHDAALIGTDRRVFVFKKGLLSGAAFGRKLASWDSANVTGVQLETGMVSGVALVQDPGVEAADTSAYGTGKHSALKAPNAVVLSSPHFEQAQRGVAELRRLVAEYQAPRPGPGAAGGAERLRPAAAARAAARRRGRERRRVRGQEGRAAGPPLRAPARGAPGRALARVAPRRGRRGPKLPGVGADIDPTPASPPLPPTRHHATVRDQDRRAMATRRRSPASWAWTSATTAVTLAATASAVAP